MSQKMSPDDSKICIDPLVYCPLAPAACHPHSSKRIDAGGLQPSMRNATINTSDT